MSTYTIPTDPHDRWLSALSVGVFMKEVAVGQRKSSAALFDAQCDSALDILDLYYDEFPTQHETVQIVVDLHRKKGIARRAAARLINVSLLLLTEKLRRECH